MLLNKMEWENYFSLKEKLYSDRIQKYLKWIIKDIKISPKIIPGNNNRKQLIPDALSAVISLSEDKRPNVIMVATKTAMGIAKENIHAEL